MEDWQKRNEILYPLGVTLVNGGAKVLVCAEADSCRLLLYRKGEAEPCETLEFDEKERIGNVWSMDLKRTGLEELEYCFEAGGKKFEDPFGREFSGREHWADTENRPECLRSRFVTEEFCWDGDRRPQIPLNETFLYRVHVRGFTRHDSSGVKAPGTFRAVMEKIPYMKELGVTAVELMPVTEFDEVMLPESGAAGPFRKPEPTGVINYWGYAPSLLLAPKAAYASGSGKSPVQELKELIRELHKNGMECIPELYFTGKEHPQMVLHVLRYWVQEYHADGFRLSGFIRADMVAEDPFLADTKLFCSGWEGALPGRQCCGYPQADDGPVTVRKKHLAEYNDQFQTDMRRLLKGDEDMMNALAFRIRRNPPEYGTVNYMANTNGFTMMDMVSYDRKHNEKNGEDNRDGSDYNYSWNCGAEGPTRKRKVLLLRKKQLRNAFLLLFLSQGTPAVLAGDEFGNSQGGNNNAYCQDNEISWLDWNMSDMGRDILAFVRHASAFRKKHPVFHMDREPRLMDYRSLGRPDMSYHGVNAWKPEYENFRRQLGILYWGPYGKGKDGGEDDTFYVACNMHWEPHVFGLPNLPKGCRWHVAFDTSREAVNGFYEEEEEPPLKNQKETVVPPRTIMVLRSRVSSGYYTYDTSVGEITISCRDGAVTGIRFGKTVPGDSGLEETRTSLTDQAYRQLEEYFAGKRTEFDLPLDMEGTEFQKKVWKALLEIPYGETRSYKEIAARIGDEKACRAVGMANNRNPIAIVVPCHRVVGAGGSLTGYAGGLDLKEKLLTLEKQNRGTAERRKTEPETKTEKELKKRQ